jgi:hypothetical protein
MARELPPAPMSEPVPVPCHFLEGIEIEPGGDFLRIVGWIYLTTGEEMHPERRIVSRDAMTLRVARELRRALGKALARPKV